MAIHKIARMGHPVLRKTAEQVTNPTAPRVQELIRNMVETMQDADGTGLAAPQIHVPLRVVVFFVSYDANGENTNEKDIPLTVLINPKIEPLSNEKKLGWEGCLSLPGLIGKVPRYTEIRYRSTAPD